MFRTKKRILEESFSTSTTTPALSSPLILDPWDDVLLESTSYITPEALISNNNTDSERENDTRSEMKKVKTFAPRTYSVSKSSSSSILSMPFTSSVLPTLSESDIKTYVGKN